MPAERAFMGADMWVQRFSAVPSCWLVHGSQRSVRADSDFPRWYQLVRSLPSCDEATFVSSLFTPAKAPTRCVSTTGASYHLLVRQRPVR